MAIKLDELEGIGETIADSKARVTLARALRQLRRRYPCGRRGSTRTPRR